MARAVALLFVDPTQSSEIGTVLGPVGTTYQRKCRKSRKGKTCGLRALKGQRPVGKEGKV